MRSVEESGGAFGSLDWLRFGYVHSRERRRNESTTLLGLSALPAATTARDYMPEMLQAREQLLAVLTNKGQSEYGELTQASEGPSRQRGSFCGAG